MNAILPALEHNLTDTPLRRVKNHIFKEGLVFSS
jgi:hypothetical protein